MTQSYETKVIDYVGQAAMINGSEGRFVVAVFLFIAFAYLLTKPRRKNTYPKRGRIFISDWGYWLMDEPKVQIIVPVYNAQSYIKRCLDSLIGQSYTNWEAIVIDDASTDSSADIIKDYMSRDARIACTVLEENLGVSKVRNLALSKLTAKYTAFLDSDDYWEDNMLSSLVSCAEKGGFDVVQCRYIYDYPGGRQIAPKGAFSGDTELDGDTMKRVYIKMMTGINMNHVCMKLIRTELIGDLRFDAKLKTAEDLQFCVKLFGRVKKYCFIDKAMYHYQRSEGSLTGKGLTGREKLYANRIVSKDLKKALPGWGIDTPRWRLLCDMRPYIIIVSKIIRMLKEKLFS